MALFGFGKNKNNKNTEEKAAFCGTESSGQMIKTAEAGDSADQKAAGSVTSIKVLGSGCKSCYALYENARAAAAELGLQADVEYVTDMAKIMQYGIMSMPALVINEKVVSAGRTLKPAELKELLLR